MPAADPPVSRPETQEGAPRCIGPYRIESRIGEGSQGEVYLARDERLRRRVAIKVVARHEDAVHLAARIRREAQALSRVEHPGVCTVYDVGEWQGRVYVVMQYVAGPTLAECLDGPATDRGTLARRLGVLEDVARALHAAHEAGVVHRDVKPRNVILAAGDRPVLCDFGVARLLEASDLTRTGQMFGTPSYMAPEQIDGTLGPVDRRADVFAFGVVAYEWLTGERPFRAGTLQGVWRAIREGEPAPVRARIPAAPADLQRVLDRALAKRPGERYPDLGVLADDLRALRRGEPLAWPARGAGERLLRQVRRRPLVVALLFVLLTATPLVLLVLRTQERRIRDAQAGAAEAQRLAASADYAADLVMARAALEGGDVAQARERLEACPPDARGWEWRHLMHCTRDGRPLARVEPTVVNALILPDGNVLVADVLAGNLRLLDGRNGKVLREVAGLTPNGSPGSGVLALSPDGREVAAVSRGLAILDAQTLAVRLRVDDTTEYTHVRYAPSGDEVFCGTTRGDVLGFDARTGAPTGRVDLPWHWIYAVHPAPDARRLAVVARWGVGLVDLHAGRLLRVLDVDEQPVVELRAEYSASAYDPERDLLVVGRANPGSGRGRRLGLTFHPLAPGAAAWDSGVQEFVSMLAFVPGQGFLCSGRSGDIKRIDERGHLRDRWVGPETRPFCIAMDPSRPNHFVTVGYHGTRLWSWTMPSCHGRRRLAQVGSPVTRLAWGPRGALWVASRNDLRRVDPCLGDIQAVDRRHASLITGLSCVPSAPDVVSADVDETLWLHPPGDAQATLHPGRGRFAVHLAGEGLLACSHANREVVLWRGTQRVRAWELPWEPRSLACTPDGRAAVVGSTGRIGWIDLRSDAAVRSFDGPTERAEAVALSPDGALCAVGDEGGTLLLVDPAGRTQVLVRAGRSIRTLAWHPVEPRLAVAGYDGTVWIWDVEVGRALLTLPAGAPVETLAFSPDGETLACGLTDGSIWLYETRSPAGYEDAAQEARRHRASAEALVQRLMAEHEYTPLALAALQADASVAEGPRRAARALLLAQQESPTAVAEQAWAVLLVAHPDAAALAHAARAVDAVRALLGQEHGTRSLQGALLERRGQYADALAQLLAPDVDALHRPRALAFAALALAHQGEHERAQETLRRLATLRPGHVNGTDPALDALVDEVLRTLGDPKDRK